MKKFCLILALIFSGIASSQIENQTFIELGITNDTPFKQLMNNKYKKKIYKSPTKIYSVQDNNGTTEIIEYNSDKSFANFYFIKDDKLIKVSKYNYIDQNLNEITPEQQEMMKEFYTIYRDSTKTIANLKCFKVAMQMQQEASTKMNMYVSDEIPNLPNHFPLASNVLNAEPLEIEIDLMGSKVLIGIVNLEEKRSIEQDYNINFDKASSIEYSEYQKK
ncbi:hypothetical protein [uncultured Marixanthomonas sp.]|uniref:hypothetical protein n=1 Tax=uncultured Marixanthomonas sp. TaxID=757245 RepID=UPI0030DB962D|tara:strand:- start:77102 stop:77758 length:657 start_codon:yes stop_codon:yes gene_type:complete